LGGAGVALGLLWIDRNHRGLTEIASHHLADGSRLKRMRIVRVEAETPYPQAQIAPVADEQETSLAPYCFAFGIDYKHLFGAPL
jgi:hypothetical protein